jgi:hypothetical protein
MIPDIESIKLMALIEEYNMKNNIDSEIQLKQTGTILNLIDNNTGTSIGIIEGTNLEDAYARMFSKLVNHVRLNKLASKNDKLSIL